MAPRRFARADRAAKAVHSKVAVAECLSPSSAPMLAPRPAAEEMCEVPASKCRCAAISGRLKRLPQRPKGHTKAVCAWVNAGWMLKQSANVMHPKLTKPGAVTRKTAF